MWWISKQFGGSKLCKVSRLGGWTGESDVPVNKHGNSKSLEKWDMYE